MKSAIEKKLIYIYEQGESAHVSPPETIVDRDEITALVFVNAGDADFTLDNLPSEYGQESTVTLSRHQQAIRLIGPDSTGNVLPYQVNYSKNGEVVKAYGRPPSDPVIIRNPPTD